MWDYMTWVFGRRTEEEEEEEEEEGVDNDIVVSADGCMSMIMPHEAAAPWADDQNCEIFADVSTMYNSLNLILLLLVQQCCPRDSNDCDQQACHSHLMNYDAHPSIVACVDSLHERMPEQLLV